MKKNNPKFTTISIPTPLVDKIKQKIKGTGIHSPSAYVTFLLREIFSEGNIGKQDIEVKQRLKNLGYL